MKKLTDYIKESLLEPEADIVDKKFCYKVGSYYNDGKIEGIVASLKDNGSPHLIMSLDQPKDNMTWNEAMEYNKALKDGWHIPSKEELEEIWHNDPKVTDILNKALETYNKVAFEWSEFYWSSSEYSKGRAWYLCAYLGGVTYSGKDLMYYVRPFITLF